MVKYFIIFILLLLYAFSWVLVRVLCEYKYLICKGNCKSCHNWQCKYFAMKPKMKIDNCSTGFASYFCPICGKYLNVFNDFCSSCGRSINWFDEAKR